LRCGPGRLVHAHRFMTWNSGPVCIVIYLLISARVKNSRYY
jgi:hypothetical protein